MAVYQFGGNVVQPSQLQFKAYTLSESVQLAWPYSFQDADNVVAVQMNIATTVGALTVGLPSALETGVGTSFFVRNQGSNNFDVNNFDGDLIQLIAPGLIYLFYLTDNSTAAGDWDNFVFGAGSSSADAQTLAGLGLIALPNGMDPDNLNVQSVVVDQAVDATISAASRSNYYVCTQPLTLTAPTGLVSGLFFCASNQSSGVVEVAPGMGALINGVGTSVNILPTQSACFTTDGTNWFVSGNNQSIPSTAKLLNYLLENGTYNYLIPPADMASNNIIVFGGSNDGACAVTFDGLDGEWIFQNLCTNPVSVRFSGAGTTFTLNTGDISLLYGNLDTTTLYNVPTSSTPLPIVSGGTGADNATDAFDNLSPLTTAGDMLTRGAANNQRVAAPSGTNLGAALVATDVPAGGDIRPRWQGMGTLSVSSISDNNASSFTYVATPITQQLLTTTLTRKIASSYIVASGAVCVGPTATASTIVTIALENTVNGGGPNTLAVIAYLGGNTSTDTLTTVPIYFVDQTAYVADDVLVYYIVVSFAAAGTLGINQPASGSLPIGPTTSSLTVMEVGNTGGWNV